MKFQLKQALKENAPLLGTVVTIGSPVVAEIMAHAGWDYIWFDLEHSPMSLETLQSMLQATNGSDVATIVRVPANDEVWIKRILDVGPDGIIVPLVNSAEDAAEAVRYTRYPPLGVRGAGLGRAQGYGEAYSGNYFERTNELISLIVQIETIEAVERVESIIEVPGVDGVFLGNLDLTGSMGLIGQTSHPKVNAAMARVLAACQERNMSCGIMTMDPEGAKRRRAEGYQNIGLNIDVDSLASMAAEAVKRARGLS